ncbi:MAG TPA: RsmG family class I SAM-dependent methyltransferase, partial [Thermomicrobiales bacterium]|nr:RsmG family class I SAM-dependent methyltransferase [Thermomicrobiales bacterium]
MNPIGGTPSRSAPAETDDGLTFVLPRDDWSGLAQASGRLAVPLDADATAKFALYRDLLLERNAQFNLTAIRDPDEVERRLFLDAIAMTPVLDRIAEGDARSRGSRIRLVDVGAG